MSNPRDMLKEFNDGMQEIAKTKGEFVNGFTDFLGTDYKPGAVDTKTKELISVAIAAYARCEYCVVCHVHSAFEAGATSEEILESAMVAVVFGGGPSMTYIATLVKDAIKEFASDFKK